MFPKVLKTVYILFSVTWMIIMFTEYWRIDPIVEKSIVNFQYTEFLACLLLLGGGAYYWIRKKRKLNQVVSFNGLGALSALVTLDLLIIFCFYNKVEGLQLSFNAMISQLGVFIYFLLCLILIYIVVRTIGMINMKVFSVSLLDSDRPLVEIGLGIFILVGLMFTLAFFGLLYGFVLIPIALLIIGVYWRFTVRVIMSTFLKKHVLSSNLNALGVFSFLFLGVFIVLNFIMVLRPVPFGSDALNVYVNLPVILSETNQLVSGHQPYNWSLFMSLGLLVFGKMEAVLALSYFGGVLAILGLYQLSKKWLNVNYSALVILIFYVSPMVSFLSYQDMKVDMGMLFYVFIILILYISWQNENKLENKSLLPDGLGLESLHTMMKKLIPTFITDNRKLVLMGLFAGFALGIKLTALFFFLALLSALWYTKAGYLGYVTAFFLCFLAVLIGGLDNQPGLRQFHKNIPILSVILFTSGLSLLTYLFFKKKNQFRKLMAYSMILGSFFLLPIIPWLGKNYIETKKVSITALMNGAKDTPNISLDFKKKEDRKARRNRRSNKERTSEIVNAPEKLSRIDRRRNKDVVHSISEDVHRFMGCEILPLRYMSLPYDVFMKPNVTASFTDVGFLLIILLPIVFLFGKKEDFDWQSVIMRLLFMICSLGVVVIAIPGAYLNANKLTSPESGLQLLKSEGLSGIFGSLSQTIHEASFAMFTPVHHWISNIYLEKDPITYPVLLLTFLFLSVLVWTRMRGQSLKTRSALMLLLMYFSLWWFLGAGIPWYGILIFSLTYVFLFAGIEGKVESGKSIEWTKTLITKKYVILSISIGWVFMAFTQRMSNYNPQDYNNSKYCLFPSVVEYQAGTIEKNTLIDYHFPSVRHFTDIINNDRDALVYRVGTAFSFFIENNERRVLSDNFVQFFEELNRHYDTKEEIFEKLAAEGFKYMVVDLKISTYDKTIGKTLDRKFNHLMNALHDNDRVELMATDRRIKLHETGEEIFDVNSDNGDIIYAGDFALYKIK